MTYGAGGSTREKTIEWVKKIKFEFGMESMCHLTCIGQSKSQIKQVLEDLNASNIENIIALRGDPPAGDPNWRPHPEGFNHAVELVREAKSYGFFSIAVAGFPETHPQAISPEDDLRRLKEKVDAGADVVITQLFFDNESFFRFAERARKIGIQAPIVPGIMPVRSVHQVRRMTTLCKASIPAELDRELSKVEQDEEASRRLGIDYATRQCQGLLKAGVPGLHFYSLNETKTLSTIFQNLGFPMGSRTNS